MSRNRPTALDDVCIKDGQHAHNGSAFWNPEYAPGPMCEKHKNEYLQENDMERKSIDTDYTHPDKRTPAWKEQKAHEAEYNRHKIVCGCNSNL